MPAPATTPDFLDLVRKSGLVDGPRLDAVLHEQAAVLSGPPSQCAEFLVREALLTPFLAEQLLQGKWKCFTLGKYLVLQRLRTSSMASFYLGKHLFAKRLATLKVLPRGLADNPATVERFHREARALAALDPHPNIIRALDVDQDESGHFMVMEFADGATLSEILDCHGPMAVDRAAHYVRQAARGLQHLHDAGLVHRNIKPGMLILDRRGVIRIRDLGIARFAAEDDGSFVPRPEGAVGTVDFMSPEQISPVQNVDARSDIYSLGCTFYFLLTGRNPFGGETVAQALIRHQTQTPTPIRSLRPEVPQEMSAIVERMMAREPAQRYQTADEVADALAPWTQQPIPPPPETEMPELCPLVRDLIQKYAAS
jgi:serine/threonine protein kinase